MISISIYLFISNKNAMGELYYVYLNNSKNNITEVVKIINKYFYISNYLELITQNINVNTKTKKIDFLVNYFNEKWKIYPYTKYIT